MFIKIITSSILETEIGEPPDVAKAHCVRDAREGKVPLAAPGPSLHLSRGTRAGVIHHILDD